VITVHDLSAIEHPEWFDWKYALWNRMLIPPLLHRVQHIITVSNYTQARIQDLFGVPRRKITTIYNGVDDRFMPRPADEIAEMRTALDLPTGPYVLSLSALQPRKNLQRLLKAWARIQEELQGTTLVLAGGAGRPTIFQSFSLDRIPPNVIFTDYVADEWLPALYSGASAFAYPSLYEGFGLPVLEAMACGTPVVTSNRTSLPEVAGQGTLSVDPFDVGEMANAMRRLLHDDDLRSRLQKRGKERASEFRWEKTASKTLSILKQNA
jgi:glycosyltransferase involved in cell wall biosynthesis